MHFNGTINASGIMDSSQTSYNHHYYYTQRSGTHSEDDDATRSFQPGSSPQQELWPDFQMDIELEKSVRHESSPSLDGSLDITHEYLDRILSETEPADIWEDGNISDTVSVSIGELEHNGILSPLPVPLFPLDPISGANETGSNNGGNNNNNNKNNNVTVPLENYTSQTRTVNEHKEQKVQSTSSSKPLLSRTISRASNLEVVPTRFIHGIRKKSGMQLNFEKARNRQQRCRMSKTPTSSLASYPPMNSALGMSSNPIKSASAASLNNLFNYAQHYTDNQHNLCVKTPTRTITAPPVPLPIPTPVSAVSTVSTSTPLKLHTPHFTIDPIAIPTTTTTTQTTCTQDLKDFKRMAHKEAEKGRRDRLNNALNELASLIPEELKATVAVPSKASTAELACVFIRRLLQERDYLS